MKNFIKLLFTVTLVCATLFVSACGSSGWDTEYFTYFNTNVTVTMKDADLKANKNVIDDVLKSLENELSTTKENSPVYAFNNAEKDQKITLSDSAFYLLERAVDFNKNVSNKFSPAIYPLLDLWQFTPEKYGGFFEIPSDLQIEEIKPLSNLDLIQLSTQDKSAFKSTDGVMLDFGGVAKGYALTLLTDALKNLSPSMGYISLGGSSIYVYSVPDYLSISHPRKSGDIIRVLPQVVENSYIGTSGDYQRFYTKDGKRYSHILDPDTGKPSDTGIISVTVICDDGAFSDMLSTALSCYTYEELSLLLDNDNLSYSVFAVYDKDGKKEILTNKKQGEDFTLLDTDYLVKEL